MYNEVVATYIVAVPETLHGGINYMKMFKTSSGIYFLDYGTTVRILTPHQVDVYLTTPIERPND